MNRPIPAAPEAEKAVLCCFLIETLTTASICAERRVSGSWFHTPAHALIYGHVHRMWSDGTGIDLTTLTTRLHDYKSLESAGGPQYISEIYNQVGGASNLGYYLDILEDNYLLRETFKACNGFCEKTWTDKDNPKGIIGDLFSGLSGLLGAQQKPRVTMRQAVMNHLDRMQNDAPDFDVVKTGISGIDSFSPFRLGDMPLISGIKKSGKSILSLTIGYNIGKEAPILYFSLEDSVAKVVHRLFSNAASLPAFKHHHSKMSEHDFSNVTRASQELVSGNIEVRDDIHELGAIVAAIRQHKAQFPAMVMAVIDYGQLVKVTLGKNATRENEVSTVSRTLRLLGLELGVIILVLSQLNKDGDTRESKGLENDCTAMIKVEHLKPDDEEYNTKRLICIPFQRNGDSNVSFYAGFSGPMARFSNLANSTVDDE